MEDGDSASASTEVYEKEMIQDDIAVEHNSNSSSPKVAAGEPEINGMDFNKAVPAPQDMDVGENLCTPNNDKTTFCKDSTNTVIHSVINVAGDADSQKENDSDLNSNPFVSGLELKSQGAKLSALSQLCAYDSDSDHSIVELPSSPQSDDEILELKNNYNYRTSQPVLSDSEEDSEDDSDDFIDDSSSTTSSSSSSSSTAVASSDDSDSDSDADLPAASKPEIITNDVPRTKGELDLDDLPPIEDLHISLPEHECVELGVIESIVGTLVVVQAMKNSPALDLDSVLFLDHGKRPLGRVFDVFGPVTDPFYCIRFNSVDHIREKDIEKGVPVYCAPRTEYSSYVFLPDLLKMKGSDASWEFNNEPPQKFLDYSDDEEERRAKKGDKGSHKEVKAEDPDQPCRKKRNNYEAIMNSRNLKMSAINPPNSSSSRVSRGPWGDPLVSRQPASIFNIPPPSVSPIGAPSSPSVLIRPPSFSVPPPSFGIATYPAPMFSSPPPTSTRPPPSYTPIGTQVPSSSLREHPVIPNFDPTLPPPAVQTPPPTTLPSQFNVPPPVLHNADKLPSHLFQIPPPPPLPSVIPPPVLPMDFLSSPPPPPQNHPNNW